jgi:hypothetical protein
MLKKEKGSNLLLLVEKQPVNLFYLFNLFPLKLRDQAWFIGFLLLAFFPQDLGFR